MTSPLVKGQPFEQLPLDLYIPPDALSVVLEAFEGPLDLLLYLIKRQNLDILDIDVFAIASQYSHYLSLLQANQMDLAADYMVMAATLAEIKSRMLLPRPEQLDEDEEQDPRAELIRRLQAYEQSRQGAEFLQSLARQGQDWWSPVRHALPELPSPQKPAAPLHTLAEAWQAVQQRQQHQQAHQVQAEARSAGLRLSQLRHLLLPDQVYSLQQLVEDPHSSEDWVVNFMAVMELTKEGFVDLEQLDWFGPLWLKRRMNWPAQPLPTPPDAPPEVPHAS